MTCTCDTDHLSLLQRGGEASQRILTRLSALPSDDVAVTIVSFEEQTRGWLAQIGQQAHAAQQIVGYAELKGLLQSYCFMAIVDFDADAVVHFDRLRALHRRHGTMDLKIAAIALAQNATLVTRNRRDFDTIDGLRCEDWAL